MEVDEIFKLTPDQEKATKILATALKACHKVNLGIHNCSGILLFYDKALISGVSAKPGGVPERTSTMVMLFPPMDLSSWADDAHYYQLTKMGAEKLRQNMED